MAGRDRQGDGVDDEIIPAVLSLLEDVHNRAVFKSPKQDYRVEYTTTLSRDRVTKEERLSRVCRLHDDLRSGVIVDPWGPFELDKQARIASNLLRFTDFTVSEVMKGWKAKCRNCGKETTVEIWQNVPKACNGTATRKCRSVYQSQDVVEVEESVNLIDGT
jgi:hypothetical protein